MRRHLPFAPLVLALIACNSGGDGGSKGPSLDAATPEDGGLAHDAGILAPDSGSADAGGDGAFDAGSDGGSDGAAGDAGEHDAGTAGLDAGATDAGTDDAGAPDAGEVLPHPGFGTITGDCGLLDDELTSSAPSLFRSHIDFGTDPYDDADYALLTQGGRTMIDVGNAGGSSLLSEVFAYELLARCEDATLVKTETEVVYTDPGSTITDLLVAMDGQKFGVSVTRAVSFPFDSEYTQARASALLEKKLEGILESTANVAPEDAWVKQLLVVIAYGDQHADAMTTALAAIDPALKADTIVLIAVSDGDDAFLY